MTKVSILSKKAEVLFDKLFNEALTTDEFKESIKDVDEDTKANLIAAKKDEILATLPTEAKKDNEDSQELPELEGGEELPGDGQIVEEDNDEDAEDIPAEDLGSVGKLEDTVDIDDTGDLPTDEDYED